MTKTRNRLIVLAVVLPPLAVGLSHEPDQVFLNVVLTLCLWLPGVAHALWVVSRHVPHAHYDDGRIVAALRNHLMR
jgi:uncharacterized membrane protein YqaE (UPF0057 family)